ALLNPESAAPGPWLARSAPRSGPKGSETPGRGSFHPPAASGIFRLSLPAQTPLRPQSAHTPSAHLPPSIVPLNRPSPTPSNRRTIGAREVYMPLREGLKKFLDSHQAKYAISSHHAAFTAREVAAVEHLPAREVAKVVVVFGDGRYHLIVVPANRLVDFQ